MNDVQQLTNNLLLTGRAMQQGSDRLGELIGKFQSMIEELETAVDDVFSGLDADLRKVIFQMNGIDPEMLEGGRSADELQDAISELMFKADVNTTELLKVIRKGLSDLKRDLDRGQGV